MTPDSLNNELWNYACQQYRDPDFQKLLLGLQAQYQADINIILSSCWAAETCRPLEWPELQPCIEGWQLEIIQPLRTIRQRLKKSIPVENQLRSDILQAELLAERIELAGLFWVIKQIQPQPELKGGTPFLLRANLTSYLQLLTLTPSTIQETVTVISQYLKS